MAKLKTKQCTYCAGKGQLPADNTGMLLMEMRLEKEMTPTEMAAALGISGSYLYDLERDRRNWTNDLVERYQAALKGQDSG